MAQPLVVVSTFRVTTDNIEELRSYYQKVVDIVQANEPRAIAFHGFLDEDGSEMTSIQVHPDTESMAFHMQVLRDNWDDSFSRYAEMLEPLSVRYYGVPPEATVAMDAGKIDLQIKPRHVGGFTRTQHA